MAQINEYAAQALLNEARTLEMIACQLIGQTDPIAVLTKDQEQMIRQSVDMLGHVVEEIEV